MTDPATSATHHNLLNPDLFPDYLLHDSRDIVKLIRALADKRALLTAHINGGQFAFVTAVLAVSEDPESVVLDASPDEALNARATTAEQLICVAQLDGIKVQFGVATPQRVAHEGYTALRSPLPASILRLQRREFYRLPVPLSQPLSCIINMVDSDGKKRSMPVRILDISNGGIAVAVPPEEAAFAPGAEFHDCTLSIPDGGTANVKLKVRNVFHANPTGGMRAGCEFIDLPSKFMAQIQRYIFKIERERRTMGVDD